MKAITRTSRKIRTDPRFKKCCGELPTYFIHWMDEEIRVSCLRCFRRFQFTMTHSTPEKLLELGSKEWNRLLEESEIKK